MCINSFNAPHVFDRCLPLSLRPLQFILRTFFALAAFCASFTFEGRWFSLFILGSFLPCHSLPLFLIRFFTSLSCGGTSSIRLAHAHIETLSWLLFLSLFVFAIQSTKIKCVCQMMMLLLLLLLLLPRRITKKCNQKIQREAATRMQNVVLRQRQSVVFVARICRGKRNENVKTYREMSQATSNNNNNNTFTVTKATTTTVAIIFVFLFLFISFLIQ